MNVDLITKTAASVRGARSAGVETLAASSAPTVLAEAEAELDRLQHAVVAAEPSAPATPTPAHIPPRPVADSAAYVLVMWSPVNGSLFVEATDCTGGPMWVTAWAIKRCNRALYIRTAT